MNRIRSAVCAVILCALVAATPAAAETADSAPVRPLSDGGFGFPEITGPESPEEYPFQLSPPGPEMRLRQVSDQEVLVEYVEGGIVSYSFRAVPAHAADGATVPTSIALTEDEEGPVVTLIAHFRAGNPAAGGAPFVFPISGGAGWEGGYRTSSFEMNEPKPPAPEPQPASAQPAPICKVPSLHGLGLSAARAKLVAADCRIGQVHLARGATRADGKVVKQFRQAGSQLVSGAPVAVKLARHQG